MLYTNPRLTLEPEQTLSHNFLQWLIMREAVGRDIGDVITNHRCVDRSSQRAYILEIPKSH